MSDYRIDQATRDELLRMRRKLDNIRGPGVVNTPDGIWIQPPSIPAGRPGASPSPGTIPVRLVADGGYDGSDGTDGSYGGYGYYASWTYTLYGIADASHTTPLATHVPLYTRRLIATGGTVFASYGLAFLVSDNTNVGFGGSAGNVPSSSTSSSSGSAPIQPYRLLWCDESYLQVPQCVPGVSSSSGG